MSNDNIAVDTATVNSSNSKQAESPPDQISRPRASIPEPCQPQPTSAIHKARVICKVILLVLWIVVMLFVYGAYKLLAPKRMDRFYNIFHAVVSRAIFSMRVNVEGEMSQQKPTLYLSNHISYLDIFVLGAKLPAYFIAKSEVANWPILGTLAKMQNTLFFERRGNKIRSQLGIMSNHFNEGKNLTLFPEGTSTEGEHVEPFKSSLLQSIEQADESVTIQPVTVAYTHYNNQVMDKAIRDQYAWYATMPFGSHFFNALGLKKSQVKVIFHPAVKLSDFETRKECALHCWQQVSSGLEAALN